MFRLGFAIATGLVAGSAAASSIDVIHGAPAQAQSITVIQCAACGPAKARAPDGSFGSYNVPDLPPGQIQSIEFRDAGGKREIVRTEQWMGGSPVVFVTKAPATMQAFLPDAPLHFGDGIDAKSVTAALVPAVAPTSEQSGMPDVSSFELRQ
ncbi:plant virulence effector HPE1-like domain-containing protein [Oryzifoliimicrobium ureilyticus]|uniref:plant virulence effector HPE1-like domain-containing protein n=1 Tax=Oryzifoliimicrobium ureilyticus TaxID=3113724 RepID=UPI003076864D